MKLTQIMKQAQEMQDKMQQMQNELNERDVEGNSGGGLVKITMSAKGKLRTITLDPSVVNNNEIDVLEDLIIAAFNQARSKADAMIEEETREMMGGLNLPPNMKLPF